MISLMLSIFSITVIYSKDNIKDGMLTTIISMSINYIISFLAVIIAFAFVKMTKITNNFVNLVVIIISHFMILIGLFKIKKTDLGPVL